jgi:hypothetical protein
MTFVGTCHFTGWGAIFYTAPERKPGQRHIIDKEGRYILEVGE